jgi:hypothetical protein
MDVITAGVVSTGATIQARLFVLLLGVVLSAWTMAKLRDRRLLVALGSVFLAISAGLMLFAAFPASFDALSYRLGVKYPPLLYVILAVVALLAVNIVLAARLSVLDVRCRRLAQELALRDVESRRP